MSLSQKEVDELRAGTFVLEALDLSLTRRGDAADIYRGPGFVRQAPDGQLEYRVYDRERKGLDLLGRPFPPRGAPIPDEECYDLRLRDQSGRNWVGERTIVYPCQTWGEPGYICRGVLREIACAGDTSFNDNRLWLFFPGEFKIPANAGTRTIEVSPLAERLRFEPNAWTIKAEQYGILITTVSGGMEVVVDPVGDPLPEDFDVRLQEAIWFTLAVPALWTLSEEYRSGNYRFRIRTVSSPTTAPRLRPPLEPDLGEPAAHLGDLLIRYLRYVLPYEGQRFHPISVTVKRALQGSAISLNAEALALSVAIESLVRREFTELGRPGQEFIGKLESAIRHFNTWPEDVELRKRITNVISGWKGTNPRESLKQLAKMGVITKEQLKAWNTLRHTMAHGQELDSLDELPQLCVLVHAAWIRLMFQVLGYAGLYTDRSTQGWPSIEYRLVAKEDTKQITWA